MTEELSPDEEKAVLLAIAAGNTSQFDALVRAYQPRIFAFLCFVLGNRHDAEELTQEAFLSAYRNLNGFAGRSSFYTWIRRIAYNLAVDLQRRHRTRRKLAAMQPDVLEPETHEPSAESAAMSNEARDLVHAAISKLPSDQRHILVLRDMQAMDYSEIAELLSIPIGTVRSRLHRARIELRSILVSLDANLQVEKAPSTAHSGGAS
jgi:RNA polymerase sigma-70 factor (ECF subfamily)